MTKSAYSDKPPDTTEDGDLAALDAQIAAEYAAAEDEGQSISREEALLRAIFGRKRMQAFEELSS